MKFEHIGWMKNGTSDKVWGMIRLRSNIDTDMHIIIKHSYVIFWGRRGAKLQTKLVECSDFRAMEMFFKKLCRGYQPVDKNKMDEVYPEFQSDLEKTALWANLRI